MKINSNHSNLAFDREIANCRNWLQIRISDACGYSSGVLQDRLLQLIADVGRHPYAMATNDLCRTGRDGLPVPGTKIDCSRVFMETGSGRLTVTPRQWLFNQVNFLLHWGFCLAAILAARKSKCDDSPAVLVYGVGEEALFLDGSDEQFISYCRKGPIAPLRNGRRFLVQSGATQASTEPSAFAYSKNPLIDLAREATLGFSGRLRLLLRHLSLFPKYLSASVRFAPLSFLGKDLAYSRVSLELDRHGLIESFVLTISGYTSQPLWLRELRRATVHMVWYAQNFKPVVYASDRLESFIPSLRWIRVDTHWVWTRSFAQYLGGLCKKGQVEVVGPIVWYLPQLEAPATTAIKVAIFDISPFGSETALSFGDISNYNRPDNLFSFVRDIISLKPKIEEQFGRPVSFRLKTKRGYKPPYDRAYFDFLEERGANGTISLEHHSTNIYSLISGSHVVVAYPFTSPAYIAEALGVPAIYYDPTNSVVGHHFGDSPSLIDFASSPDELLNSMLASLRAGSRLVRAPRSLLPAA